MAANSFGKLFRITTFGESHGAGIGVVIDGCPAGLNLDLDHISSALARRRPGQSALTTSRKEPDEFRILSGVVDQTTTGAPLTLFIENKDARPADYDKIKSAYRPSHADYTYEAKFGIREHRGGGRSSARETAARVAAGAIADQILSTHGIRIQAYVQSVGNIEMAVVKEWIDPEQIENSAVRCPDTTCSDEMSDAITRAKESGDSLGGVIACYADNIPAGLGAPVFDRLEADLAKAMLSINACKGFEIGSGFKGSSMKGSEHNDPYYLEAGDVKTRTNNSGGVQGGISNGMPIYFRCAFKPTSTIKGQQETLDRDRNSTTIKVEGRHDPCVVPRAVPIVEAMTALVLVDHLLRAQTDRMDQLTLS